MYKYRQEGDWLITWMGSSQCLALSSPSSRYSSHEESTKSTQMSLRPIWYTQGLDRLQELISNTTHKHFLPNSSCWPPREFMNGVRSTRTNRVVCGRRKKVGVESKDSFHKSNLMQWCLLKHYTGIGFSQWRTEFEFSGEIITFRSAPLDLNCSTKDMAYSTAKPEACAKVY